MTESTSKNVAACKVSIIVRTMNRPGLLREALASISDQTCESLEIVVVNDGGADVSQVAEEFKGNPFELRLIDLETNLGRSAAANAGLQQARGEYILFLDDDDLILPDQAAALAEALDENSDFGAAYSDVQAVDESGDVIHTYDQDFNQTLFLGASFLPIHGVMFRRLFVEQGHSFDERLDVYEDWDFWARLSEKTGFLHVSGVGALYRDIGTSKIGNINSDAQEIRRNRLKLYDLWLQRWDAERILEIFDGMLDKVSSDATEINNLGLQSIELSKQIQLQQKHIESLDKVIDDKNNAIRDAYNVSDQLNRRHIQASQEIDYLKAKLQQEEEHKNAIVEDYERRLADMQGSIDALYQSSSWRMTAPVRKLATAVYRIKNRNIQEKQHGEEVPGPVGFDGSGGQVNVPWPLVLFERWLKHTDQLHGLPADVIARCRSVIKDEPLISIVMPVYNPKPEYLQDAVQSVINQSYENWEFCIADDCSSDPQVRAALEKVAASDPRIKLVIREENGHISRASNSALELASGEFIALLDHDDRLNRDALLLVVAEINRHPDVNIIFSDEDKISEEEGHCQPYFKGDFNYDLFLSHNMISHLGVYRHELLKKIGGFRVGLEGSQDYDLALRCLEMSQLHQVRHIPTVLYHWRSYEGSTALLHTEKSYALEAAGRAIREHLDRSGHEDAELIELSAQGAHRVRYPLPQDRPLVSIVLVVDTDQLVLQQNLLKLLDITDYDNAEIIVSCTEDDADMARLAIGGFLASPWPMRLVSVSGGWPTLVNRGVDEANGEIVAIMHSSIETTAADWLSEMVRHALRPQVGVVGVRILAQDNSVQHAGLILRPDELPGFPMQGPRGDHPGYFGRALLQQNYTAVSPVCSVFRRSHFDDAGGMDDEHYGTPLAAIDFCLKLREKSLWHTWTPFAEVRIRKSGSYPFNEYNEAEKIDMERLKANWSAWFEEDPVYNPNLSLTDLYTAFADPPRVKLC